MKNHRQKICLAVLITFFFSSLAFASGQYSLDNNRIESRICYGKLYRIKKQPNSLLIFVNSRQFKITKETPALFERAEQLLEKKVQVIYNKKNNHVINLFGDHRQEEPR